MEKYTMFMDQKNQYRENEYTTQSNLQIQYDPYQAERNQILGLKQESGGPAMLSINLQVSGSC